MDGKSLDIKQEKINKLKELMPEVFTEGDKIDVEKLKETLGEDINTDNERYVLNWAGKNEAFKVLQSPTTATLAPDKDESVNFDTTENIFIEGENLEALKILQKSYYGKVKMIYIDPPYNTGSDSFIYPDKFSETKDEYLKRIGEKDEEGFMLKEGLFRKNSKDNGRYHSNWLSMMYPRLFLARNLLSNNGVIFVSIDDNEVHNLRLMMNEIFGEENFINIVSVNMKNIAGASGGGEDIRLKKNIEYLVIYTKNYSEIKPFNNAYDYIPVHELVEKYREEDVSWKYTSVLIDKGTKEFLAKTVDGDGNDIKIYKRISPIFKSISQVIKEEDILEKDVYKKYADRIFQTAMPQSSIRPRVMKKVHELGINHDFYSIEYIPKSGRKKGQVYEQFYKGENFRLLAWLSDVSEEIDDILYKKELKGTYWDYASETKNLTKEGGIPYPNGKKPLAMLKRIVQMATNPNDNEIVLDFFAGSGTTAHAILELNKEDNGNRKNISIQLDEIIEETDKNEIYNTKEFSNVKTVADILKIRLNNAILKIKNEIDENNSRTDGELMFKNVKPEVKIDLGFKVFKLKYSNFKLWRSDVIENGEDLAKQIGVFENPVKEGAEEDNILYELLLKSGYELTTKIEEKNSICLAANGEIAVALKKIDDAIIKQIIKLKPQKCIALDRLFKDNDQLKTNTVLQMKDAGIEFKTV